MKLSSCLDNQDWFRLLNQEFTTDYFQSLQRFLTNEYARNKPIFPAKENIFAAFNLLSPKGVKVVILGQDPYHQIGQAHGLAFSVPKGVKIPPSLKNIYKEVVACGGEGDYSQGDLTPWVHQGVFLLNTVLTVEEGKANSHRSQGWETFTDRVIQILSDLDQHIVFLLWGKPAQSKMKLIDPKKNSILTTVHPSPLSAYRGFLGCAHFSQTNEILLSHGEQPIRW